MNDKQCPICGRFMTYKRWIEDYYLVEYVYKCHCGYQKGWSYGYYGEDFPVGWYRNDNGNIAKTEESEE